MMFDGILESLQNLVDSKKPQNPGSHPKTLCLVAPSNRAPRDLPIYSVEVTWVRDVVNAGAGSLLLIDTDKLEGDLRFLRPMFEDPLAFNMDFVILNNFPESNSSPAFERWTRELKHLVYSEWESNVRAAIATLAAADRNEPNGRLVEVQNKKGQVKGMSHNFNGPSINKEYPQQEPEDVDDDEE